MPASASLPVELPPELTNEVLVTTTAVDHLSIFPTELLEAVADVFPGSSLPSLRATNKSISEALLRSFALAHFETRHHIYSTHSLEALVAITAHPILGS